MNTPDLPIEAPLQRISADVAVDKTLAQWNEPPPPPTQPLTPAQARVEAVASVLAAAYAKASTLELSPEAVLKLKADFPDEAFKQGAAGKADLIYIEHAFLRDRFDEALGMGQWALVRTRPHWGEDFRTSKGEQATRIYADCALLVRGALVSEAIGDMVYYPNNATQNYGDAAEGAVTAAFRRCAKQFGVGLQAWKKDFCEGWWARRRAERAPRPAGATAPPAKDYTLKQASNRSTMPQDASQAKNQPKTPPNASAVPDGEFLAVCTVLDVVERTGVAKKTGKPWTGWFIKLHDGFGELEAGTFSSTIADLARAGIGQACQFNAKIGPGQKKGTHKIIDLTPLEGKATPQESAPPTQEPLEECFV